MKSVYWLLAVTLSASAPAAMAKTTHKHTSKQAFSHQTTAAASGADSTCSWHETRLKSGQNLDGLIAQEHLDTANSAALKGQLPSKAVKNLHAGDAVKLCLAQSGGRSASRSPQLVSMQIPGARKVSTGRGPKEIVSNKPIVETDAPPLPTLDALQIEAMPNRSNLNLAVAGSLGDSLSAAAITPSLAQPLREWIQRNPSLTDDIPTGSRLNVLMASDPARSSFGLMRLTLATPDKSHEMFGYSTADGRSWLLQSNGVGMLHLPLLTPVESRRISSGWGWRDHPVKHTPEFHKGVDFEAAMGTPVRAAAAGTVEFAGWHGNYGRLLVVRHAEGASTRYGHLSGFASGLHAGDTVAAGDLIGYVGRSGLATGPHLYFELYLGDEPVNPLKDYVNVPVNLDGSEMVKFEQFMHNVDTLSVASAS